MWAKQFSYFPSNYYSHTDQVSSGAWMPWAGTWGQSWKGDESGRCGGRRRLTRSGRWMLCAGAWRTRSCWARTGCTPSTGAAAAAGHCGTKPTHRHMHRKAELKRVCVGSTWKNARHERSAHFGGGPLSWGVELHPCMFLCWGLNSSGTSECALIGDRVFDTGHQVQGRSFGWVLTQYDWGPYKVENTGHRDTHRWRTMEKT